MSKLVTKFGVGDIVTSGITALIGVLTGNRQAPVTLATLKKSTTGILKFLGIDVAGNLAAVVALSVSPMDFNAKADGTNDAVAVANCIAYAAANNLWVRGGESTYSVSGNLEFFSLANVKIDGLTLKQLTPGGATNRRTLLFSGCEAMRLRNIVINRNGSGTGGALNDAAGLWISGGSGHRCHNLEAYGNDAGSGIAVLFTTDSHYYDLYGHDMAFDKPGATDDMVQGVWFSTNVNCVFNAPRAKNLSGNTTGQTALRFTRGIAMGANTRCTLISPKVESVDQGIDASGGDNPGNTDCQIIGGNLKTVATWGIKFTNTPNRMKVIGVTVENAGLSAFVVAGPPDDTTVDKPRDIDFIGCTAINTGVAYTGIVGGKIAFRSMMQGGPAGWPRGIRFIDCIAIDTQGTPTMEYGFHNEVVYDGTSKKINEVINCKSIGHITAAFQGFHSWAVSLTGSSTQTLTTGVMGDVNWDSEDYDDCAMHSGSSNVVTIGKAGQYRIETSINFNGNVTGLREVRLRLNGVDITGARATANAVIGGDDTVINVGCVLVLAEGDNVSVRAQQKSGGDLTVQRAQSFFKVTRIAA